jgi:hypothetical protein
MNKRRAAVFWWWVASSGLAMWGLWGAPWPLVAVALVASAVCAVTLLWCAPGGGGVRLVVYVAAVLANQVPAITGGFWPLLPGHHLHKVTASPLHVLASASAAVVAVATFLLVRAWVDPARRRTRVARRATRWWPVVVVGSSAAAIYFLVIECADAAWHAGERQLGISPSSFPDVAGDFGAWMLSVAAKGLAGVVEEPVFVGLVVLLWPALRARTFVLLALLSGVLRASIHFYYAAGTEHVGTAIALVVVWCVVWSSTSLLLIYKTRLLWPVVVAHGFANYLGTLSGPYSFDASPLHVAVVAAPAIAIAVMMGVAGFFGLPQGVEALSRVLIRRWPKLGPPGNAVAAAE